MDQYPRGKLCADDEGVTEMAVGVVDRTVRIGFKKPMRWIGMDKQQAIKFAQTILKHARTIEKVK